jgi:hypothetical protein
MARPRQGTAGSARTLTARASAPNFAQQPLPGGDTVENTVGVLGFDFNLYRIQPIA